MFEDTHNLARIQSSFFSSGDLVLIAVVEDSSVGVGLANLVFSLFEYKLKLAAASVIFGGQTLLGTVFMLVGNVVVVDEDGDDDVGDGTPFLSLNFSLDLFSSLSLVLVSFALCIAACSIFC